MNITKKILIKLYITQKKSLRLIAKELHTNQTKIYKLMYKYKIKTRKIGSGINWQLSPYYQHLKKQMQLKRIATMKKNGIVPWNKNLTKETDLRVRKQAETFSKTHFDCAGEKNGFYGKKHTDKKRKEWSLKRGGTGTPYENSDYPAEWTSELRDDIRKRDNHICQICGMTEEEHITVYGRVLDVHHKDYNKQNCKKNNLISLCFQCHRRTNYNRKYWLSHFSKLVLSK